MEIFLVRHGDCYNSSIEYFNIDKNTMDPPLTSKGIEQTHKLVKRLNNLHFDKIYSSDLKRAKQTSEIIQKTIKSDIILSDAFREINMGELFQKSWNEYPEIYAKWKLHEEDISYPNGENGADVWNRCKKEIELIEKIPYERIIIVCHGGTIRSIICGILKIPQQKRFYLGFPPENCSISMILYQENEYYMHTFNDYKHISN
jgi:broad specificity phosphatase PhoE